MKFLSGRFLLGSILILVIFTSGCLDSSDASLSVNNCIKKKEYLTDSIWSGFYSYIFYNNNNKIVSKATYHTMIFVNFNDPLNPPLQCIRWVFDCEHNKLLFVFAPDKVSDPAGVTFDEFNILIAKDGKLEMETPKRYLESIGQYQTLKYELTKR